MEPTLRPTPVNRRLAAIGGQLVCPPPPSRWSCKCCISGLAAAAAARGADRPLKGKRALVTGGSRGVGESCCLQLAALGADVAVNYARTADRAAAVVKKCEALGVKAVAIGADVGDDEQCIRLVEQAVSALGGLDILINNAGFTRYILFEDLAAVTREQASPRPPTVAPRARGSGRPRPPRGADTSFVLRPTPPTGAGRA